MKKLLSTVLLAILYISCISYASAYETLRPGSNGQEVLDARIRLYELGYFSKMPTRTDYTNDMSNYVKKFEADYGLYET